MVACGFHFDIIPIRVHLLHACLRGLRQNTRDKAQTRARSGKKHTRARAHWRNPHRKKHLIYESIHSEKLELSRESGLYGEVDPRQRRGRLRTSPALSCVSLPRVPLRSAQNATVRKSSISNDETSVAAPKHERSPRLSNKNDVQLPRYSKSLRLLPARVN